MTPYIKTHMNGFQLKILACLFMVIDHMAQFLPGMPIWMHWIGRLSAPIFYFLIGWSCMYTHDRRRLLLRLYLAGIAMSVIQALAAALMSSNLLHVPTYVPIDNNFFATLFQICLVICLLSAQTRRERTRNISLYAAAQLAIGVALPPVGGLIEGLPHGWSSIGFVLFAASGTLLNLEGGALVVLIDVVLWATHEDGLRMSLAYIALSLVYLLPATAIAGRAVSAVAATANGRALPVVNFILDTMGISPFALGQSPFTANYQWMMVLALPFMLLYDHRRGPHVKWFFYVFYPAHIVVLFLAGIALNMS